MNFFSEQDQARRNTRRLLVLFLLAVIALIAITNFLVAFAFMIYDGYSGSTTVSHAAPLGASFSQYFSWLGFAKISAMVSGVVLCAILYKWLQVSAGGKRVAESLGGERISPNTRLREQQRILNVVEEMAIASGMPVPPVYLLPNERGINAFAAGNTPADAVIGITQGALEQFDRQQLQGVVAHEFSHILNGDMRLNIRMIALLHGILFIGLIGRVILRGSIGHRHRSYSSHSYSSGHRSGNDGRVMMLGFGFLVVGWLGSFLGGVIKAAVSRQREYLADASAVQFTRNPQGIADALKIIGGYSGGSRVRDAGASEVSHLFISNALGRLASFATHPPLAERIRRIEPGWNGQLIKRKPINLERSPEEQGGGIDSLRKAATLGAAVAAASGTLADADFTVDASADEVRDSIDTMPRQLREQARDSFGAIAVVYGLLMSNETDIEQQQLAFIQQSGIAGLSIQTLQLLPDMAEMNNSFRLPLLEMAMPALKTMSAAQYKVFKKTLLLLIRADRRFEMFEWCLYQLVRHYLDAEFEKHKAGRPLHKTVKAVATEFQLVLSMLVYSGSTDEKEQLRAFGRGSNAVGLYNIQLLPREECQLDDFIKSVNILAKCFPLIKPKLIKGLADSVRLDGRISVEEREILSAVAAVMDCPMPGLGLPGLDK